MSKITDFYSGVGTDAAGRTFDEVMQFPYARIEFVHDWVQWAFPLRDQSNFNPDAPLLTEEDERLFKSSQLMQDNLFRATKLYLDFLGLEVIVVPPDITVQKASHFEKECRGLFTVPNHNWFRISRVLGSVSKIGGPFMLLVGKAFFECLRKLHEEEGLVSEHSFEFWQMAAVLL